MEGEDRATSIGLFNYAHSYSVSAIELQDSEVRVTHPDAPVYYLYYHAIELYLKSYLRANGVTVNDLSKKYSHRALKTANATKNFGLIFRSEDIALFDIMHKSDAVIETRYIVTGSKQLPTFEALRDTCSYLHKMIGSAAFKGSGITRLPVFPQLEQK